MTIAATKRLCIILDLSCNHFSKINKKDGGNDLIKSTRLFYGYESITKGFMGIFKIDIRADSKIN